MRLACVTLLLLASPCLLSAQGRPMTAEDLWAMGRVGAPVASPDGRSILYTVTRYDLEADRGTTQIWMVPTAGGEPRRLTSASTSSTSPAWSPDGRRIAFVSARTDDGPQIWLLPAAGGEPHQLTRVPGGASGPVWSPDGSLIAFASDVWPDDDPSADRLRTLPASGSSARIYDDLMFRHWTAWEDGTRSHVLVADPATGETRDLTPGPFDAPPIALGGFHDYDVSPDGGELAFVRNTDSTTAVGTGNDIWLVPTAGGEPRLLTESDGNDVAPRYSPDGRWIAYLAQARPGFESDRAVLTLYDRRSGERRPLTAELDRSVRSFEWSRDSRTIWLNAQDGLDVRVYYIGLDDASPRAVSSGHHDGAFALAGRELVVGRESAVRPTELVVVDGLGKEVRRLTRVNDELVSELALQPLEPFRFEGAGGDTVEGFMVKPPSYDPARSSEWPVVFLVHGGPQGAWTNNFHYRWNYNLFAAPGYIVLGINPRGSTGYGQRFTDQISEDWGGKVFTDLMAGLDHALTAYPWLADDRIAAAGASYGGYMMNWFQAHTDRFSTLINHDGVFDLRSFWGSTEELWFPEWELGGAPWESPGTFERWNPAGRTSIGWETPMLVIHGGLDYRVPLEQGLAAFTTLRRKGVPARLLYFPDEGHFVLRPANALVWWDVVHEWLAAYL